MTAYSGLQVFAADLSRWMLKAIIQPYTIINSITRNDLIKMFGDNADCSLSNTLITNYKFQLLFTSHIWLSVYIAM